MGIIYIVFTVGYIAALLAWSSGVIEVGDGELRAARAVLPLSRSPRCARWTPSRPRRCGDPGPIPPRTC